MKGEIVAEWVFNFRLSSFGDGFDSVNVEKHLNTRYEYIYCTNLLLLPRQKSQKLQEKLKKKRLHRG